MLCAVASPGCELPGWDSNATVRFFAAHAGTETEAGYPDYGDEETTRVFMTDMGWQIALHDVFITTAEVKFVRCDEDSGTSIEMFWGPCPESFVSTNDLESVPLGAVTVEDGNYCSIDVVFGPFVPPTGGDEPHVAIGNPMIEGNTLHVRGFARRGEPPMQEEVLFEIVSDVELTARIDVSTFQNGGPIKLADEQFPRDVTLLKTYDRFFDGIDFSVATEADIEASIIAALESQTFAIDGTFDSEN
jgi:hypothetical protein